MATTKIYLNQWQKVALLKALNAFAKEGFVFDTIKIVEDGMEVEPTTLLDMFRLGLKVGVIMQQDAMEEEFKNR